MSSLLMTIGNIILSLILSATLMSLPVWLLWNWLMPQLFGLPVVTWLQAWGLMALSAFLFKDLNN